MQKNTKKTKNKRQKTHYFVKKKTKKHSTSLKKQTKINYFLDVFSVGYVLQRSHYLCNLPLQIKIRDKDNF
jgi:hypothetical protein